MEPVDEAIIERIKRKDEKAFDYIVEKYGGLIKSVVNKHMYDLGNHQDECINDILLAIWNHIECYDSTKNSLKNWIAVISKYTSLNYVKKYKKETTHIELEQVEMISEDSTVNRLIQQDTSREVEKLLGQLKQKDRELFIELYLKDKSIDEVCLQTGMQRDYIYNRVSRGKKKLKTLWQKGGKDNG